MPKYRNPNYPQLVRAVKRLGGEVVSWRVSGKHFLVNVRTKAGAELRLTLSKAPMRNGHVDFWVRNHMSRADKRVTKKVTKEKK